MPDLESLKRQRDEIVEAGTRLDAAMSGDGTIEQRNQLRRMTLRLAGVDKAIAEEAGMADDGHMRASLYGEEGAADPNSGLTPGEVFIRSEAYRQWTENFPSGGPAYGDSKSGTVGYRAMAGLLGLRTPTAKMRTLITSADTSAGDLVSPLHRGLVEPGLTRPLTLRQLVTVLPISTDSIEYVKETGRVQAAAPVAEATALTGTSGTKPEGGLTFDIVVDTVKTLAIWVPATKRILQDAPQLQSYINEYIINDLGRELEDQMLSGSGSGKDFRGILNTPGVLTQTLQTDENNFDSIRRAKYQVVTTARTTPTAVVLHPEDATKMDIAKSGAPSAPYNYWGTGPFGPGNGPGSLWGMRVVESDALSAGTALVGDFGKALLYDRESVTLSVGTVNDDYIRNLVRMLGELRAGFGVLRPSAFCTVALS